MDLIGGWEDVDGVLLCPLCGDDIDRIRPDTNDEGWADPLRTYRSLLNGWEVEPCGHYIDTTIYQLQVNFRDDKARFVLNRPGRMIMIPHYDKDNLPEPIGEMDLYRKVGLTRMTRVKGPFTVATQEGELTLDEEWEGFIAIDTDGYPYPIEQSVQESSYELRYVTKS